MLYGMIETAIQRAPAVSNTLSMTLARPLISLMPDSVSLVVLHNFDGDSGDDILIKRIELYVAP